MDAKILRDKLVGSDDERGVSPVIGVILMVAITVILAAVIATLVMDIGDTSEPAPNTQWESSLGDDTVNDNVNDSETLITFEMISGDQVDASNLGISPESGTDVTYSLSPSSGQLTAGDTVEVVVDSSSVSGSETISEGTEFTITWSNEGSSAQFTSFTLADDIDAQP